MGAETYSFLDVAAALTGVGGNINVGAGAGVAEEGITIEMSEDKDTMVIGADGEGQHNLHAGNAGAITIRLLKTSPTNSLLMEMYNVQRTLSSNWGGNTLVVRDPNRGDVVSARGVAFRRAPTVVYGKEGPMNEWAFNAIKIDHKLGTGTPVAAF